jgi:WD40 repeat protein
MNRSPSRSTFLLFPSKPHFYSPFSQIFLENLPLSSHYEKSYMHRDNLTHLVVSRTYDYLITASCDGHIKFWKKMLQGIEFVKHFQAHLGPITGLAVSPNDQKLVTIGEDRSVSHPYPSFLCYSYPFSLPSVVPEC